MSQAESPDLLVTTLEIITVVFDRETGTTRVHLDGIDPWSAHSLLLQAADRVYDEIPPALLGDEADPDDSESSDGESA